MATSRASHRRYREQRARLLRTARANDEPCCFCGQPIEWDAPARSPWSPSADHVVPVSRGGREYGADVEMRPCHLRCNTVAGNRWGTASDGQRNPSGGGIVYGLGGDRQDG